ncbi:hypothetical protein SEPCBS119000_006129 [Sporothrix epigloea]|uniref:Ankyrin repeat protein n=1 Tax=Sporothrix epigloea TaxID=1892477 RepID=A0ABP0E4I0_9PEZI
MAGIARYEPRVRPDAALSGLPARLRPPADTISSNPSSDLAMQPAPAQAFPSVDHDLYMCMDLDGFIDQLGRLVLIIRNIFRVQVTAWEALRQLYNEVLILQKLITRLRHMLQNLSQIESVAKHVNVYEPATANAMTAAPRRYVAPLQWSSHYLPLFAQQLAELCKCVVKVESECQALLEGRQNGILMVTTESLYAKQPYDDAKYLEKNGRKTSLSFRGERAQAMNAFWSGIEIATAAKMHHVRVKRMRKKQKPVTEDRSERSDDLPENQKDAPEGEENSDPMLASVTCKDLVSVINRKKYSTAFTLLMSDVPLNTMLKSGEYLLSNLIRADHAALMSAMIMCGADPHVRDRSGSTLLHLASFVDSVSCTLLLLELGVHVDACDAQGLTPLHVACREMNFSIVLQLLTHGADPNMCDLQGLTPLAYAFLQVAEKTFWRAIVHTLLTYGARAVGRDMTVPPLFEYVLWNDGENMGALLRNCPSLVEFEMSIAASGSPNGSACVRPLYVALKSSNSIVTDQLLRAGADVNHITTIGDESTTYLGLAVRLNWMPAVQRLLVQGADPNLADSNGVTPLYTAAGVWQNDLEVAKLLLRHGADPYAVTRKNLSQPLHAAVLCGRAEMCELLLQNGASIDKPLRSGSTPLMLAVYKGDSKMARFLISRGANVHWAAPVTGQTVMHAACWAGSDTLATIFLGMGLSVNAHVPFPPVQTEQPPLSETEAKSARQSSEVRTAKKGGKNTKKKRKADSGVARNAAAEEADVVLGGSSSSHPTQRDDNGVANTAAVGSTSTPVHRSLCGFAPIHAAVARGRTNMVRWLLANGADPEARIGSMAAKLCLRNERLEGTESKKTGGDIELDLDRLAVYGPVAKSDGKENDDTDPGITPAQIAHAFGHYETAAVIQDAILINSPTIASRFAAPLAPLDVLSDFFPY